MAKVTLRKTRETRVRGGHPWIYASEIEKVEGAFDNGDIVDVADFRGKFIGRGFYNPQSQISLRILTRNDEPCDRDFFARRIQEAWDYRRLLCDPMSCRLIYSESDFLPGLVVDKFADVLVLQSLSLGIERIKDMICDLLMEIIQPVGIWERSDVPVRRLEGMEQTTGLLRGEVPDEVDMVENGIHFLVDVKHGQKTGFFLDQKQNRAALAPLCRDARVLDCFCHNGSFSLHAAKYGARSVLGVDISEEALEVARRNAALNGFENVTFEAHNCFDLLHELTDAGEKFDLVILDPPAFTKNKAAVPSAIRGYKEINLRGLKLVRPGGFLVTCSCSQHVLPEMFQDVINQAARDAKKRIRLVEYRTQGYDHPILPQSVETKYLKTMIIQVME
ncbi:MAG: class I SAM-dependent rRNA methyltransferase [Clostridia bacterium]|nr:class I SAM-dependent rRNA methyltransferase [Clostridia bacterium]MBQ6122762.1 class I SAM-dependent rRNA methyltransferase [Clostridia bacterium]